MFRKKLIFLLPICLLLVFWLVSLSLRKETLNNQVPKPKLPVPTEIYPSTGPTKTLRKINQAMSFAAQAPFGDWKDPRQQDGCEEASSLLAVKWARNEKTTKEEALQEIFAIARYEEDKFGSYRDTSAKDTAERILKGYFKFTNYKIKENIKLQDIIDEIEKGNILITPMNGQALGNPNYTGVGPDRHMLVVKGYDPTKRQIITNDVGTRQGENYAYNENIFFSAIRDYPTGNHLPIEGVRKSMIVISKE